APDAAHLLERDGFDLRALRRSPLAFRAEVALEREVDGGFREDVEVREFFQRPRLPRHRVRPLLPPAPGGVVLPVIGAAALLEELATARRPGELVAKFGQGAREEGARRIRDGGARSTAAEGAEHPAGEGRDRCRDREAGENVDRVVIAEVDGRGGEERRGRVEEAGPRNRHEGRGNGQARRATRIETSALPEGKQSRLIRSRRSRSPRSVPVAKSPSTGAACGRIRSGPRAGTSR